MLGLGVAADPLGKGHPRERAAAGVEQPCLQVGQQPRRMLRQGLQRARQAVREACVEERGEEGSQLALDARAVGLREQGHALERLNAARRSGGGVRPGAWRRPVADARKRGRRRAWAAAADG